MSIYDVNKNYTLGRGKLMFGQFLPGTQRPNGERYLGNSPELTYTAEQETLDHYYSDGGIRVKDASVILQQDYMGNFTLDDINLANMAMFFLGEAQTLSVVGGPVTDELHSGVRLGFRYQLGTSDTNPQGVRQVSAVTVSKVDTPSPVPLVAGQDYVVDEALGAIQLLDGGTLADGDDITVDYTVDASTRDQMISKGQTIEGSLRYIADNPRGAGQNFDYFMPYVKITPNGDLSMKGDDWMTVPFSIEILKKGALEAIYIDGRPYTPTP